MYDFKDRKDEVFETFNEIIKSWFHIKVNPCENKFVLPT